MENINKIIGERIKIARKDLRITQNTLAKKTSIGSAQIISMIEKGERALKVLELSLFAKVLHKDINFFITLTRPTKVPSILWRRKGNSKKGGISEASGFFINKCQQYNHLENLVGSNLISTLPSIKLDLHLNINDFTFIKMKAKEISDFLQLGSRPARSLEPILEQKYGIKILCSREMDTISAASTIGEFGPAILINGLEAPWRRNYDLAHELFHILTWDDNLIKKQKNNKRDIESWIEKLAESFASILLIPDDELDREIRIRVRNGKISKQDLVSIARDFDVSIDALLWRCKGLYQLSKQSVERLLKDKDFRKIDRMTHHSNWRKAPELPKRFVMLGVTAYKMGKISKSQLANYFVTSIAKINDLVTSYGFSLEDDDEQEIEVDIRC